VPIERGSIINCLQKYFWAIPGWEKTKSRKKTTSEVKKGNLMRNFLQEIK